ncbi:MAG: hypothetical protein Fur0018_09780 [Anaerolineales bacterium]
MHKSLILALLFFLSACQPAPINASPGTQVTVLPAAGVFVLGQPTATLLPSATASQTPRAMPTAAPSDTPPPPLSPTPTIPPEIALLFTGQIVPARCVQAGVDAHGSADYIYDNVRGLLQSADATIGTLNASLSDYAPMTGCIETFVLTGSSNNAAALHAAGFDVMSVATNHIKNCNSTTCGNRAFLDTLTNLRAAGIQPVGAGETLAQALQPVVLEIQGIRFVIVSLGEIERTAFAGTDTPGIAPLNEENLRRAIATARQMGDVVIVMPHWGPEYTPNPNWNQRTYAQIAVEAGADLVVGNHPHVVQAMQYLHGIPVFYGLGNMVFDQTWDHQNQQSVLLRVHFRGTQWTGYEFIPLYADGDGTLHLADAQESAAVLARIQAASTALPPVP